MGWKSTINISREKALALILSHLYNLTDEELGDVMDSMFGDNTERPHYGHNFTIQ